MLRLDDLENGYSLYQDPALFCFGMDAVLLASFEEVRTGEKVMDLCTGNGIVPHLMAARAKGEAAFYGLELLPASAGLARASVAYNKLEDRITIEEGDVREAAARYAAASFSMVTCNPPYVKAGSGLSAGSYEKELARSEIQLTFADVAKAAAHLLPHGGRFVLVHRPARLPEILSQLQKAHLEP
ncbi:MAG: tRNA1(Val) (adenine(37)-N6)-methyltransferase, partial [bacterium]